MPSSLNPALDENNFGDVCAVALVDNHRVLWNKDGDKLDPTNLPQNKNLGLSGVIWTEVQLAETSLELIRNSVDDTFTVLKEEKIPEKPRCEFFDGHGELILTALDEPFNEEEELRRFKEMAEKQRILDKQRKVAIEWDNADGEMSEANLELLRLSIEESLPPPIQRTSILVLFFTMGRTDDLNSIGGNSNEIKMYPELENEVDEEEGIMNRSFESPELVPLEMDSDFPQIVQIAPSNVYKGFSDVKYAFALEEMETQRVKKMEDEDECRSIEGDGLDALDMDASDLEETDCSEKEGFEEVKNGVEVMDEEEKEEDGQKQEFGEVKNESEVEEEDDEEEEVSLLDVSNPKHEESFESLTQEERKMLGRRMLFF